MDSVLTQRSIPPARFSPNTYHAPRVPAVVVYVESTEDVVRVMKTATKYRGRSSERRSRVWHMAPARMMIDAFL